MFPSRTGYRFRGVEGDASVEVVKEFVYLLDLIVGGSCTSKASEWYWRRQRHARDCGFPAWGKGSSRGDGRPKAIVDHRVPLPSSAMTPCSLTGDRFGLVNGWQPDTRNFQVCSTSTFTPSTPQEFLASPCSHSRHFSLLLSQEQTKAF